MRWQEKQPDRDADPLDQLLADARWDEPKPETLHALRAQWQSLMLSQSAETRRAIASDPLTTRDPSAVLKRSRRRACALVAATILVSASVALWTQIAPNPLCPPQPASSSPQPLQTQHNGRSVEEGVRAASPVRTEADANAVATRVAVKAPGPNAKSANTGTAKAGNHTKAAMQKPRPEPKSRPSVAKKRPSTRPSVLSLSSRPPSSYEQLILVAHRRTQASAERNTAPGQLPTPTPQKNPVDLAIETLIAQPNRDAGEVAQPLLDNQNEAEATLAIRAEQFDGPWRTAAIRLLAAIATSRSLAQLQQFAALPEVHDDVVRSIARRTNATAVVRLIRNEPNRSLRQELWAMLLERGDEGSVRAFLACAEDADTSIDALQCVARVQNPPVRMLFEFLRGPRGGQRTAAARVLGRLNQANVSSELVAMVMRGTYRQEALIGLLSSSEATAQQFLAGVAIDPMYTATLWNANRQFQNL